MNRRDFCKSLLAGACAAAMPGIVLPEPVLPPATIKIMCDGMFIGDIITISGTNQDGSYIVKEVSDGYVTAHLS